jgi:signal transduction histidine kinase
MRTRRCGPGQPPWWPDNEPWPYRGPAHRGYVTRLRFFRRFAWLAGLMLLCAVSGMLTLAWLAATGLGIVSSQRGVAPILLATVLAGAVAAAAVLASVLRRIGTPLGAVMEAADRVAGGDYSVRVGEHGPPPIRALGRAFNTMTERLQSHDRLRRDLMADVAHELRTPLTVMQGKLEGLLDGVYPRDDRLLEELLEETHVLSRLVEDLRTVALSESGALKLQKEPTDLGGLARDVAGALAGDAAACHVTLAVEAAADLAPIAIDPVRVREVLTNLLLNALRHTPPGGSVAVRVAATPSGGISVDVRDTGTGMTPDDVARAFDRFYKGPESRGSGLGLTIARGLVVAHGGEIQASSEIGRGTTITFTLTREGNGIEN